MAGSIERVMAALELREPDRVPTFDVMEEYANIYEILGKKPVPLGFLIENKYTGWVIDRTAPLLNRLHVLDSEVDRFSHDRTEASVKFGYDSAWVMHTPIFRFRDSNIAEDIYGRYYEWRIDKKGNIMYPMYRGGMLKGPADWDAWDKRDILRHPERSNRAYKQIQKDFGEKIVVMGSFLYGLFEMSWQPLGIERWAVAIHREKDFMRRYIKFYEDWYCMMIEAMADAGLPAAVYSDDMAYKSGPMLSPKMIEEFFGDAFRRIVETAHRLGMKIVMHSDGNVYQLLEWYADCGFDGVHALEPTAGIELAKVKEMVGDRMCILGNIDITHILVDASKEEVFEAVRSSIKAAGQGGGYFVAPTNSHPGISMERLHWMLEAVEEYGHYPLSV
jgi:uroporphyrinogen decarboxylase